MLKKRIITTMLWNGTTLVKGHNFNNSRRTGSPISTIKVYNSRDVDEIIFYDIEKNNSTEEFNLDFIKQLTDECSVPITIGGGIKKISHIDELLFAGADKVSINTELYKNPELLEKAAKKFGSQTIVVGIDYKEVSKDKFSCISHSGKKNENKDPLMWLKECENRGAGEFVVTSIDKDGLMQGYDINMIKKMCEKTSIPIIASGGAGEYKHMFETFESGASAVTAASIYHFTEQTPAEAKKFLFNKNISVRKNFL